MANVYAKSLARIYDDFFRILGKDYEKESEELSELVKLHKIFPVTLLDLGCGTGGHLKHLQSKYKVTGVDASDEMLCIARERLPSIPLFLGDMTFINLNQHFDVVISLFNAIAHVETVDRLMLAVQNIAKHTRPGGIAIVEPYEEYCCFEEKFQPILFNRKGNEAACRMSFASVIDCVADVNSYWMIKTQNELIFTEDHVRLGLFTRHQYLEAFSASDMAAKFFEGGPTGRGLYVAVKSL